MESQSPPKQKKQGNESSKLPENYPLLGYLASGEEVWDREDEPKTDFVSKDDHMTVLREALSRVKSAGQEVIEHEATFEKMVGWSNIVPTGPALPIMWAKLHGQEGHTRLAGVFTPEEPTKSFTMILRKRSQGGYELRTCWYGPWTPPEPWEPGAGPEALAFWLSHAILCKAGGYLPHTLQTEMPPEWVAMMEKFADSELVRNAGKEEPVRDPDVKRMREIKIAFSGLGREIGRSISDANPGSFNSMH